MKFTKPSLTYEQQADLLISRGLQADRQLLISRLQAVNYYRLSGYLYPYRIRMDGTLKENTYFEEVWRRYTFDRQLRILLMDAVERIEIAVRTKLAYHHAHKYGAFGYVSQVTLPKLELVQHAEWHQKLRDEVSRSHEDFVSHFQSKYGDEHLDLPIWMVVEIMAFGHVLTMFRGVEPNIKRAVAAEFRLPDEVLWSWLRSLNAIRNICAHHARLWNRVLGYKPRLPNARKYQEWHSPINITNDRVFVMLTICKYMLDIIAPQSEWTNRLRTLLQNYPDIPRLSMGFPDNWESSPLWT